MNEFLEWLSNYSFLEICLFLCVILLTELVKWPIKVAAEKYEEKTGISKSRITWVLPFLPFIFCVIYSIIYNGIQCGWDTDVMSWLDIIKQAIILSTTTIGFYEVGKKFVEAIIAKDKAIKDGTLKDNEDGK